jgi:cell division protein FtsB
MDIKFFKFNKKNFFCLIILFIIWFLFLNSAVRIIVKGYHKKKELDRQVVFLQKRIEILKKELILLQDNKNYIEKIARKELGMIYPDEIVYKFKNCYKEK